MDGNEWLHAIESALLNNEPMHHEVFVDDELREKALLPLNRMLNFAAGLNMQIKGNA